MAHINKGDRVEYHFDVNHPLNQRINAAKKSALNGMTGTVLSLWDDGSNASIKWDNGVVLVPYAHNVRLIADEPIVEEDWS